MSPRKPIGTAVMLAGLAAFAWGLFHLIQTGTCASGGPFVIAQECPEGTGLKVTAVMVGVVVALVGGLAAGVGIGVVPLVFMTVGGASIASANLGEVPEGMGAFPYAFGVPFLVIGLLWLVATVGLSRYFSRPNSPSGSGPPDRSKIPLFGAHGVPPEARPAPVPLIPPDPAPEKPQPLVRLEQLERLAALEKSGAITSAEYERMKIEILAQP
jgi:hypothetical protein